MARKATNPQNLKPFVKGHDPRRNLEGGPKKSKTVPYITALLKEEGTGPVSSLDIKEALLTLVNLPEYRIYEIRDDEEAPVLYRIAAKALLGGRADEYMEKAFDRAIGKSTQPIETKVELTLEDARAELIEKLTRRQEP